MAVGYSLYPVEQYLGLGGVRGGLLAIQQYVIALALLKRTLRTAAN